MTNFHLGEKRCYLAACMECTRAHQQERNHIRVDLAQLIRFLVVELIYSDSNSKCNIGVTFTTNYSFQCETIFPSTASRS
jgi:hypothetical protein